MERDAESDSSEKEIDRVCDAFETAWRTETRPSIFDFVARGTAAQQSKLFYELLLVDLECRRKEGEQPSRAEYLRAYPQFSSQIEGVNFHYGASAFASDSSDAQDPAHARGPQIGTLIHHFQLVKQLGSGAMGEVWQAWDTRLRRAVAIKLPRANLLSEAELRRFLREGQAASQLKHPQLAAVHDIGHWQGSPYVVVEYVEGENLRQYLDSHELTFQAMAEICADAAEAIHHAHERGIIHRDLKPANLILDPHGRAHVIDFGLAKWSTEDRDVTIHGELLGTPAYMSPELASGQGASAGPGTDVYSLGVILYEMLTGSCPFQGDRSFVLHQILSAEPTSPRRVIAKIPHINTRIPRDLETICLKSLAKDPRRRYATIQEMAVDLRRFSRGEPILARRVSLVERAWRTVRRRPALSAAALLGLIALGAMQLAASLALTNQALLGYKQVALDTDPPGARVAFAKLNDRGELVPGAITGVTPVQAALLPGNYFVEVVWPDGQFHQVFRYVPNSSDLPHDSNRKFRRATEGSKIVLDNIVRPSNDFAKDMQEVRGLKGDDFFVDRHDLTFGEAAKNKLILPAETTSNAEPMKARFQRAANLAERLGKRLPTQREYEFLVRTYTAETQYVPTDLSSDIADQGKSGAASNTPEPHSDVIRYTAPFLLPTEMRFVRSSHPWFTSDE